MKNDKKQNTSQTKKPKNQKTRKAEKQMIERARSLRRTMTLPEQILWNCLRNSTLGNFKFRRQHPIGPYVVDFCCTKQKLVLELDGDSHDYSEKYDAKRTEFLESQGFCVIRFSNEDVMDHTEGVLVMIKRKLNG